MIRKMGPLFRLMQTRIDNVNRILREQITGIRVVRRSSANRTRQRASHAPTPNSPIRPLPRDG